MKAKFLHLFHRLSSIGDEDGDSQRVHTQKRFLIYMGVLMSGGGLLWGSIAFYFESYFASMIPFSYTVLTVINFFFFRLRKNFRFVRFFQVLISFLLPFLFQWALGGFIASGVAMLWAMVSVVGSMTFNETKANLFWLIAFSVFVVFSGIFDSWFASFVLEPSRDLARVLFVLNIVVISNIVFGLMIYLVATRERVNEKLLVQEEQIRQALEEQNRQLEKNLHLREQMEQISRHDLKNPLQMILGTVQLLQEKQDLSAHERKLLENQEKAGFRMLTMINDSLDLVKMERQSYLKEFVSVDLVSICRKILEQHSHSETEILLNDKPVTGQQRFEIQGEETLCYTMLANLIGNAVEASQSHQYVRIKFKADAENHSIQIENETAVPEEIRERFFEKYTTAGKKGGTGLGTYSAKLIVETLGGKISMQTSASAGTIVTINCPIQPFA